MKRNRSLRPAVEHLESVALLSGGVVQHLSLTPPVHAAVVESAQKTVHLIGVVVNGYGGVSPLGGVHGSLNIPSRTISLRNSRGTLKLQLGRVYRYPYVFTAYSWKVVSGTGAFATFVGSGRSAVSAVIVGGRIITWTATFYR
jgi:hypothetical protein